MLLNIKKIIINKANKMTETPEVKALIDDVFEMAIFNNRGIT